MTARYRCYYNKEWPLDEYGRIGGVYSLADLPIMENRVVSRSGVVKARNDQSGMYLVQDSEKRQLEVWVPMGDVTLGELINNNGVAEEPQHHEFLTEDTK
jgi:hypothetical protein